MWYIHQWLVKMCRCSHLGKSSEIYLNSLKIFEFIEIQSIGFILDTKGNLEWMTSYLIDLLSKRWMKICNSKTNTKFIWWHRAKSLENLLKSWRNFHWVLWPEHRIPRERVRKEDIGLNVIWYIQVHACEQKLGRLCNVLKNEMSRLHQFYNKR